jgi:hypothetical protein
MGVQQVESETPHSFLGHLQTHVAIDGEPFWCSHTRSGSFTCGASVCGKAWHK